MDDRMVDIYRCADRAEAETIRIRLAAAAITAFVRGDDAVTSMGISGGGVNTAIVVVEVSPNDYDRATRILEEDRRRRLTLGPWTCDECSEANDSAFDLCWNCGNERPDVDHPVPEVEHTNWHNAGSSEPTTDYDNTNPYRPILMNGAASPNNESNRRFIYLATIAVIVLGVLMWVTGGG